MRKLIFFATYNEAGNVPQLVAGIIANAPDADILVVDDNSSDGTVDALKASGAANLRILVRKGKLGLGTAHLLAFCYAIEHGYDVLVTMDGDGSHDPEHLPALLSPMNSGNDFTIGSRYMTGGSCDYSGYRLRISQLANRVARLLLRIRLTEFTTSYRAFRVDTLRTLSFQSLLVGGYSYFLTTVVELARRGARLVEVPIHFRERGYGESKIPPFEIFRGMANLLRLVVIKTVCKMPAVKKHECLTCQSCGTSYSWIAQSHSEQHASEGGTCVYCGATS